MSVHLEGGRNRRRKEWKEGGMEGGKKEWKEGRRNGRREEGMEGGMNGRREEGMEGGRNVENLIQCIHSINTLRFLQVSYELTSSTRLHTYLISIEH